MPFIDGAVLLAMKHGARFRIEDLDEGTMEGELIAFDREEVVPTGCQDLGTEGALTEECVAGKDPSLPVQLTDDRGSDRQLRLRLVLPMTNGLGGQDHTRFLTEGREHMHGAAVSFLLQPSSLGLAIDRDALGPTLSWGGTRKGGAQRGCQGMAIKLAQEPMQGRLSRRPSIRETQLLQQARGLSCCPLGHGENRGLGTQ